MKKVTPKLTRVDFPQTVEIVRANMLFIKKYGVSSSALNTLKRLAAFRNPDFYKAQAMRLSTYDSHVSEGTPREYSRGIFA